MSSSAVQNLLMAASRASSTWDKGAAVQRYSEALDLVDEEPARRGIRVRRGLALVDAGDVEAGATELTELLPTLTGRIEIEALLGIARALLWMERTDEAHAFAERSLARAKQLHDGEMLGPSLALVSQSRGQRGLEGDLDDAVRIGDQAMEVWIDGTRNVDLALHATLHSLNHYWVGSYARAIELGREGRELGHEVCNAQAHLDGGSTEGLALTGLGRHEEAIPLFDATIARARELDEVSSIAYALACSTSALRDLLDLDEARRRSGETVELFSRIGFESGVMQGEMDLLYADLAGGDLGRAARVWPRLWERTRDARGWERWIAPGRLAVARAEIALHTEAPEAGVDRALDAIAIARAIARPKYDTAARISLGTALLGLHRADESVAELTRAVEAADLLGHPPTRWHARAALGRALYVVGDDNAAATRSREAAELIQGFTATLSAGRAEPLLRSPLVEELLVV